MRKTRTVIGLAALWLAALQPRCVLADAAIARFLPRERIEFQPRAGEKLSIPFELARPGRVTVVIVSGDDDLVRTLVAKASFSVGRHTVEWDGRDDRGQVAPDEAYHPVLTCECGDARDVVVDARAASGGVVIEKIRTDVSSDGVVAFDLPAPARVLVRLGIKGGAMMRALDAWSPHSAGRVRLAWDGYDGGGVRLLGAPGLTVLVTAFSLPDHSVITSGGELDYFAYRNQRGWAAPVANGDPGRLERNGKRLSRQARLPRSLLRDPRVSIAAVEKLAKDKTGALKVTGPVTFRVDMPQEDKWLLQQSLYEVGFFLDHQFISEEETGYAPLSWRWDPAGTAPGEHTMTVNVSGFWGQVGVASVRLIVGDL